MTRSEALTAALEWQYEARVSSLIPFSPGDEPKVYRVERGNGPPWVLRAYPADGDDRNLRSHAAVLQLLEGQNYPTERLISSKNDEGFADCSGQRLLVTSWIAGKKTVFGASELRSLGERVGWLHSLAPPSEENGFTFPPAGMLPRNELAFAEECLREAAPLVTETHRKQYEALLTEMRTLDRFEDLPRVLIHNDCHIANAVTDSKGLATLIDWEGAGLGPALLDVGKLLGSLHPASTDPVFPHPDPRRIQAVVEGYRRCHDQTSTELNRLADAIRFPVLVLLACQFARSLREPIPPEERLWGSTLAEWQARYDAAEEIADHARAAWGNG